MLFGVDVSEFQGTIDWDALNAAANFVIIRAAYGTIVDPTFARNQSEARRVQAAAGPLGIGYYYYAYPTLLDAITSANYFVDTVEPLQAGEVLALDLEGDIGRDPVGWSKAFLDQVQARTGVKPLIYLNQSEMSAYDWSPVVNADYGLWEAQYSADKTTEPNPAPWSVLAGRQWSSTDRVDGISGLVDGDTFYGSFDAFAAYGYKAPVVDPAPAPSVPDPVILAPVPTPQPTPSIPALPTSPIPSPSEPAPSPTPSLAPQPIPSIPPVQAHPFWVALLNLVSEFFNLFKRKK